MKTNKKITISVLIPVYNSASTLSVCIESLKKQTIKVDEIIFIDNKSTDNSAEIIEKYRKKEKNYSIIFIKKQKTTSVAESYNLGLKKARGKYIVTMHSDSSLPTEKELEKLVRPLIKDKNILATYSYVLHPKEIWQKYNFWEKCQSCRVVDKKIPAMNCKFDCFRKEVLIKIKGFDDVNFDKFGDGNDADIYYRLTGLGKVIVTPAKVIHLHYLKDDYRFMMWIKKRKNMSITAGRLFKMYYLRKDTKRQTIFLLRPFLAILPFVPFFTIIGLILMIVYAFLYSQRIFSTLSLWKDPRLYLLPFINILLIYFESFWFVYTVITHKVKVKNSL